MTDCANIDDLRAALDDCEHAVAFEQRRRLQQARGRIARGQPSDRMLADIARRIEASAALVAQRAASQPRIAFPEDLPVSAAADDLLAAMGRHQALVVTGETGSGKTTQLPKICWQAGAGRRGRIALTQPRRLAAVSIADRLREEMDCDESVVAHAVRFDDRRQPTTAISVLTDGLLLAEAARDRMLRGYDCIIIDEAHERSVTIDLLLGICRDLLERRPELRLIVTSASIEAERFANWLGDGLGQAVPVHAVGGRQYPVEIEYRGGADDDLAYLDQAIQVIRELPAAGEQGDVLCFLPTERDILEGRRRLEREPGTTVLPLFGRLSPQEQRAIFAPQRGRKVVLATNIAETSVTVPGIRVVVDAGLARIKRYAGNARTERLPIEAVSQASSLQRAGRAGRLGPGRCIRCFDEQDFATRPPFTEPEIRRSNLAGVLIQCLHMRLGDPRDFAWLDPPRQGAWSQAEQLLRELGAITVEERGAQLTARGRRMATMPCDPAIARILMAGAESGVATDVATIAAFCSVQDPRLRPPGEESKADQAQQVFRQDGGDLATVLAIWDAWQEQRGGAAQKRFVKQHYLGWRRMREWADVRHQFMLLLRDERRDGLRVDNGERDLAAIHKAVLTGFLGNVLMKEVAEPKGTGRGEARAGAYRACQDRRVHLHPGSTLVPRNRREQRQDASPPWLVACEIVETSRTFARLCAPIDPVWVVELAGDGLKRRYGDPEYQSRRGQVVCEERISWRGLPVQDRRYVPAAPLDAAAAQRCFISQALAGGALRMRCPPVAENRRLLKRIQGLSDRLRDRSIWCDEEMLAAAYARRLAGAGEPITDDRSLQRAIKRDAIDLRIVAEELVEPALWAKAERGFPEELGINGRLVPLRYRYAPGDDDDGVSVELNDDDLGDPQLLASDRWIPGWIEEQVLQLLKTLPKDQRRQLIPLADSAARLAARLIDGHGPIDRGLAAILDEEYGWRCQLDAAGLPAWLRPRIIVRDAEGTVIYQGRDPLLIAGEAGDPWAALRARHETPPLTGWPATWPQGLSALGRQLHPALVRSRGADAGVAARVQLFLDQDSAERWHRDGLLALLEAALEDDLQAAAAGGPSSSGDQTFGGSPAAQRRAYVLACWREQLDLTVTDEAGWQAVLAAARDLVAERRRDCDRWWQAVLKADGDLRRRLRQPVRNLAAAGIQGMVAEDRQRLLGADWHRRLPLATIDRMPLFLQMLQVVQDQPAGTIQDWRQRRLAALDLLDRLQRRIDWRLIQALGLTDDWRRINALVEENLLAVVGKPAPAAPGTHVASLRQRVTAMEATIEAHRRTVDEQRQPLMEIRPYLDRAPAGAMRDRLLARLDDLLRRWPDTSLGADPALQIYQLQDCLQAVRRFLG